MNAANYLYKKNRGGEVLKNQTLKDRKVWNTHTMSVNVSPI